MRFRWILAPAILLACRATAPAQLPRTSGEPGPDSALLGAIPREALAVLVLSPVEGSPPDAPSSIGAVASIAGRLRDMGVLPRAGTLAWLDGLRAVEFTLRRPSAWILHDIRLEPLGEGSAQLGGLSASLVINDGGDHSAVAEEIRHFLRHYTSESTSRLDSWDYPEGAFYRLTDSRLPDWSVLEWGPLGGCYVLSIGREASLQVLRAASAAGSGLLQEPQLGSAWKRLQTEQAAAWMYLDGRRLREALRGGGSRVDAVAAGGGLDLASRTLWTVRREGRAVLIQQGRLQEGGEDFADLSRLAGSRQSFIPGEAGWYAVLNLTPTQVLRCVRAAYLAWHRPEAQVRLQESWQSLASECSVDFERDLLAELGDHIIVYDWPAHPLELPGMVTILLPIKGDPQRLYATLNKIFDYVALRLDAAAGRAAGFFAPRLRRSVDGLWYTQAGLLGPALAVTNDYVIISYSLPALERNLLLPGAEDQAIHRVE